MQKLGQHFLKNAAALHAIVDAIDVGEKETVIEIGPGHGELTMPLVRAAAIAGGAIVAIEKDHSLIAPLAALAKKETAGAATITEGDALKLLPDIVAGLRLRHRRYKIAGNIPYYITGKLLRVIGELESKPVRTVLLVQREVAERICAAPPRMNRLAASVQFWAEPEIVAHIPKKDFSPPPDVDSAVIVLDEKKMCAGNGALPGPALYYEMVRALFAQPRKTIINNLAAVRAAEAVQKQRIAEKLRSAGIDPVCRPQDLSVGQIMALARADVWG